MATNDQLKALVKSHGDGDDSQFYSVAMQVAARAARAGKTDFAQELRDLVNDLRRKNKSFARNASVLPIAQPSGELASILHVSFPDIRLNDLVLDNALSKSLYRVVREQRQRKALAAYGLSPARKILLTGPPGTGKTSTAKVLAAELGVPLFSIRLDTILTKYMGETAAKLRLIFDALAETRGVYLFDEVDALGSERSSQNDVGEIRRVLNSFLQFLEEDISESIVVAATNYPELLDHALFRRFDAAMVYTLPDDEKIIAVIRNRLASFRTSNLSWARIVPVARGLSHAEISAAAESAAKNAVLEDRARILTSDLIEALNERPRPSKYKGKNKFRYEQ